MATLETELQFQPDSGSSLKAQTVRGGAWSLAAQFGKFLAQFAATPVMARLLTPEDYGLYSTVFIFTMLFALFKDPGLSLAIIQSPRLQPAQVNTLFWISVGIGALLAFLAALSAPLLGWLYADARLPPIMLALASIYLVAGLAIQPEALLKRRMRIGALMMIDFAAHIVGYVLGVWAAWRGWHYWALVVTAVTMETVRAMGLLVAGKWRPERPQRGVEVRSLLLFGGQLTANSVLFLLTNKANMLLLAWRWGAVELGYYDKSDQLALLPVRQVNFPLAQVVHSTLSRLPAEPERYLKYLQQYLTLSCGLGMPLGVLLFVTADQCVPFFLGPQWGPSVPIFRALAPVAFITSFSVCLGWIAVSLGLAGRLLRWGIWLTLASFAGLAIGLRWGGVGVGLAYSVVRAILVVPGLIYCCRGTFLRWQDILKPSVVPGLASLAAGALTWLAARQLPEHWPLFATLFCQGILFLLLYLAGWLITHNGRRTLANSLTAVQSVFTKEHIKTDSQ